LETVRNIDPFAQFRSIACVVMGALAGALIAAPFAAGRMWLVPLSAAAGLAAGYRRRRSAAFLYFCILTILILAMLVSSHAAGPL
jgi:hypothetical protein